MHILQIGKFYPPVRGGIETIVKIIAEGLHSHGHQITVLCANQNIKLVDEKMNGVRIIRLPYLGSWFSQPLTPSLPIWLSELIHQTDMIHLHMPNPLAEFIVPLIKNNKPMIVTYHADVIRQKLLKPFYLPILHRCLKQSSKIIVSTQNLLESSNVLSKYRSKCLVIPFGISNKAKVNSILMNQYADRFKKFLLFVGRLVPYKGIINLIHAIHSLEDCNLVIAGSGPLQNAIQKLITKLRLENRVFLLGDVTNEQLHALYSSCQAFALTSIGLNEAFGISALEAMSFSKPLITTALPTGLSYINQHNVTGFVVEPNNINALSVSVKKIFESDALAQALGAGAKQRYLNLFTEEQMLRQLLPVFSCRDILTTPI